MTSLDLLRADNLDHPQLVHAFTTRKGGVSQGAYASLNLTRSRGDDAAHVAENRTRLKQAMDLDHLAFATQVHGKQVIRVDGPPRGDQPVGEGDAMITDKAGLGLCCQTADCTPILLFDPVNLAIAAIHSGWRSTVLNIIGETISDMGTAYGTKPVNLIAAIGPSISATNYRVGPEVVAEFEAVFGDDEAILSTLDDDGGAQLDVGAACLRQLIDKGVAESRIERSPLCTYGEPDRLFSARRSHHQGQSGVFGGQVGVIGLRG